MAGWPALSTSTDGDRFREEAAGVSAHRSDIVVGRYRGTVVVTVHGELDRLGAAHLDHMLTDLIDGQGNLSLIVDLHDATATGEDSVPVFADASERAGRRGGTVTLNEPPALLDRALRRRGLT